MENIPSVHKPLCLKLEHCLCNCNRGLLEGNVLQVLFRIKVKFNKQFPHCTDQNIHGLE